MKIVKYLIVFIFEQNVQKVLVHLVYAVLKLMVDLDQPVILDQPIILIMIAANCYCFVNLPLQILKSKSKVYYVKQSYLVLFYSYLVASLRSLLSLFTLQNTIIHVFVRKIILTI